MGYNHGCIERAGYGAATQPCCQFVPGVEWECVEANPENLLAYVLGKQFSFKRLDALFESSTQIL